MDELLGEFAAETLETLEALSGEVVAWEADPTDRRRLDAFFRFFHTVKGSCGFLNLPRLERLSHRAEDVLAGIRTGERHADPATISAVLAVMDRIGDCARALATGSDAPDEAEDDALIASLEPSARAPAPAPNPSPAPSPISEIVQEVAATPTVAEPAAQTQPAAAKIDRAPRTIRISLSLIDQLMNSVSDMVLARNELARKLRENDMAPDVESSFERLSACVADMRDMVSKTRMQRVDRLFAAIPRMVRDLSHELGKKVSLIQEGGDVEMDREMIEMVLDPLTHIVRNALDHGIEQPADRLAAGKPEAGTVRITARQSGNQIVIEVRDDGRGIDADALAAKAIRMGVATEADVAAMSVQEKINLVFHPGLSTAKAVSAISGRGVGMDVVRTNVERIGGIVTLESAAGHGTWIHLRVPMTLTIIPGLILRCGKDQFAMPRGNVIELLHEMSSMVKIEHIAGAKVATIRGERYALIELEDVLGCGCVADRKSSRTLMLISSSAGVPYVLGVDAVENHEELVIRPASPVVMLTGIFAGMTLPDNGCPMLLLDPAGIAAVSGTTLEQERLETRGSATAVQQDDEQLVQALHFIEQTGEHRVVSLDIVERVEDIEADAFSMAQGEPFVRLNGELVRVINTPVARSDNLVQTLHLRAGNRTACYVVGEVVDIVNMPPRPDLTLERDGVAGVVLVDGHNYEVLDAHAIFAALDARAPQRRTLSSGICYIEDLADDSWLRSILAPLLIQAGYDVRDAASEPVPQPLPHVLIRSDGGLSAPDSRPGFGASPVLHLRENQPEDEAAPEPTIYRYDRHALLGAIDAIIRSQAA